MRSITARMETRPMHLAPIALAALATAPLAVHAQDTPTTITFAANACAGASGGNSGVGYNFYASPFEVQGFEFTSGPTGRLRTTCSDAPGYLGTTTLATLPGPDGPGVSLRRLDGMPFSISSIDLAATSLPGSGLGTVTFYGEIAGGAFPTFVSQTCSSFERPLTTCTFLPAFADITGLFITPPNSSYYLQFTNVQVTPQAGPSVVPEPGTWALLGVGLVGVGGVAARRRRATA